MPSGRWSQFGGPRGVGALRDDFQHRRPAYRTEPAPTPAAGGSSGPSSSSASIFDGWWVAAFVTVAAVIVLALAVGLVSRTRPPHDIHGLIAAVAFMGLGVFTQPTRPVTDVCWT